MTTLVLEREPRAVRADADKDTIKVTLDDGRVISVPLNGIRGLCTPPSGAEIAMSSEMAQLLNGPTLMNTSALRACSPGDAVASAKHHLSAGWQAEPATHDSIASASPSPAAPPAPCRRGCRRLRCRRL